jgi:hypothetical protein
MKRLEMSARILVLVDQCVCATKLVHRASELVARQSALHQYSKIKLHEIELNQQVMLRMGHFNFCLVARVENRARRRATRELTSQADTHKNNHN